MNENTGNSLSRYIKLIADYNEGLYNYHDLMIETLDCLLVKDESVINVVWKVIPGKERDYILNHFNNLKRSDTNPYPETLISWLLSKGYIREETPDGEIIFLKNPRYSRRP